jgi:cobalt-zinc-cadmium efflux system outer membrane protein
MLKSILIILAMAGAAGAAEFRFSEESAVDRALAHNPNLIAARLRIDEARGRLRQSGRLSNPELEVELSRNVRSPEGSWSVGFKQQFPLTARLRLEKAISSAELAAAVAEVRNEERKLAGQVRTAAVKVLALKSQRAAREKQLATSRELAGFMGKRVEAGEASSLDTAQVQLESRQLETELLQLDLERVTALGDLRPLLGLDAGTDLVITGELATPGRSPRGDADLNARADFAAAQASIAAAEQSVKLARAQKWADFSLGLNAEHERSEDAPEGFERDTFVGLTFSLPLPLWNKNDGRVDETVAAAVRARKEADALAVNIRAEAATARAEMVVLARVLTKLDDELIPAAARLEEQFRLNYATALTPLPEVLRARTRRLELERQRLNALRDYHLARVRFKAAAGTR